MSTHLQGFQSFLVFLQHFVLAKLVTSSIRVPPSIVVWIYYTFENNFGIDNDFTKYLRESCWFCRCNIFSSNIIFNMLMPARFYKKYPAALGHCEH